MIILGSSMNDHGSCEVTNMGKKGKRDQEERRKKRLLSMPEWKKKKLEQKKAGIKSGTDPDRYRDPKTGERAKNIVRRSVSMVR